MADRDGVEVYQGEFDNSYWHVENVPKPPVVFREVGDNSTHWKYDREAEGEPSPMDFERVSMIEVKLCVAMADWDGEVLEAADEAHDAIVELKEAMLDARGLEDDEQRREVMLGNLEALPEVERHTTQEDRS